MKIKAFFFDCWSTLITFEEKDPHWNTIPLQNHAINASRIPWEEVHAYAKDFLDQYYRSHSLYEISASSMHELICARFGIELDCSYEQTADETLDYLDPKPVINIQKLLSFLNAREIPYYVVSNTIYSAHKTKEVIERVLSPYKFPVVIASKDYGVKKPNPLFFQAAVAKVKENIQESVYLGDAFYQDVYGSYNAGFASSVWVNWKGKDQAVIRSHFPEIGEVPHFEIHDYAELVERLEKGEEL